MPAPALLQGHGLSNGIKDLTKRDPSIKSVLEEAHSAIVYVLAEVPVRRAFRELQKQLYGKSLPLRVGVDTRFATKVRSGKQKGQVGMPAAAAAGLLAAVHQPAANQQSMLPPDRPMNARF